ncbi:suppressor of cytokine signaling 7 isoform X2 [Sceloporus undulatus]|uniref:suppressor of cytokine signaling 7 isoform X2 n=1 Tax=Sceloporus undulatus TaxID=8520 RepID=UPI001C4BF2F0|nr:suppressor of cytokine signaling 7 isoform X2 [Sceloporus undulatus]
MPCTASRSAMQRPGGGGGAAAAAASTAAAEPGGGGGEAVAAAAASYRVLSRLLGYGGAEPSSAGGGVGEAAVVAGERGLRGSQLLVFRPGEEQSSSASSGLPPPTQPPQPPPPPPPPTQPSELLCSRHGGPRCWSGAAGGLLFPPGAGLELQLAALGLRQGPSEAGKCPCLGPPPALASGEETSDALLVLEALGPDEEEEDDEEEGEAAVEAAQPASPPPAPIVLLRRPSAAPSRKGSLKVRLSRLFRTKSCSGASSGSPAAPNGPRRQKEPLPGGAHPGKAGTAGSLPDVSFPGGREQDSGRKPRLMRTQSAFSPVAFGPLFTGETVSLVDVDISQRGLTSPHPPTPPPPPRRSLSLLDAFPRIIPIRAPEAVHSQPAQHLQCPLYRPDSSSFAASLRELEKCGWYWGPMNWEDAEMKLKGKPDGSFLVRDSSDPRYILSLSFRSQGITHHTRMEHYRGTFSLWCHPKFEDRCQSVVEFIKRAIMHSKNGKFLYFLRSRVPGLPPTPVQLLYPVSRFSNVKSLQHLCRFRIRQLVRIDHIPELPLPKPLISYIRKFYYYDPQEEVYLSLKEAQLVSKQKQEADSST